MKELFDSINCSDVFKNNVKIINFKECRDRSLLQNPARGTILLIE